MVTSNSRQFKNIRAWRTESAFGSPRVVAFHTQRLETAVLSEDFWQQWPQSDVLNTENLTSELKLLTQWSDETAPSVAPTSRKHKVTALTVNVTQICNLHCTYCAAGGDGTFGDPIKKISVTQTIPQLEFFMGQLQPGEEFRLTFLGGEPLLYPDGLKILGEVAQTLASEGKLQLQIVVVTNGTLLTDSNIALLKHLKASLTISLDGPAEINDQLRPNRSGKGQTSSILEGLRRLLTDREGLGSVGVSGVFGARNSNLLAAYKFYRDLGVDWFDFTYDHLEIRPEISQQFTSQMQEVARLAFQTGGEEQLRKMKLFDGYFDALDRQTPNRNFCGAGKSFLMVDARNNLYPCPWMVGRKQEQLGAGTELWPERTARLAEDLVVLNKCESCWAQNICGGGCMFIHENKTGNKHLLDENFCQRTRDLIALTILYYEQCRLKGTQTVNTIPQEVDHEQTGAKYENLVSQAGSYSATDRVLKQHREQTRRADRPETFNSKSRASESTYEFN